MSEAVEKLRPALESLSAADRIAVIDFLNEIDEADETFSHEEWEQAWKEEIERRLERIDTEGSSGMLWSDFRKSLQEKYG